MGSQNSTLEPAIPSHLRVERTQPLSAPENFTPNNPSYSARFDPRVTQLPMIYLGVQFKHDASPAKAIANIKLALDGTAGPAFYDQARYLDDRGYSNVIFVGYWDDRQQYDRWNDLLPDGWWHHDLSPNGELGAFREAYTPGVVDTETTFSHPYPEGYSRIADRMSGETDTHEYWGSSRDRIPRAQVDELLPSGRPLLGPGGSDMRDGETLGRRIEVMPHENLCLMRSGQDWTEANGDEQDFYLQKVQPQLEKGMREISLEGLSRGCYFNRYMTIEGPDGPVEKTYSVSAWHSNRELEAWVRADTHLAIWAAGIKHYNRMGDAAMLRTYHELMVLRAQDQSFTYFNCHRATGMLRAVAGQ